MGANIIEISYKEWYKIQDAVFYISCYKKTHEIIYPNTLVVSGLCAWVPWICGIGSGSVVAGNVVYNETLRPSTRAAFGKVVSIINMHVGLCIIHILFAQ